MKKEKLPHSQPMAATSIQSNLYFIPSSVQRSCEVLHARLTILWSGSLVGTNYRKKINKLVEFLSFSCWLSMKSCDMLTMCHVVIYYIIIIAGCAYLHCLDRALVYGIMLTCSVLVRGNHCYSKFPYVNTFL